VLGEKNGLSVLKEQVLANEPLYCLHPIKIKTTANIFPTNESEVVYESLVSASMKYLR